MNIYVGADHNGFHLKASLVRYLKSAGYDFVDEGDVSFNPEDDYPIYAARVVNAMLQDTSTGPKGILICGSGQGMAIAANRFKGIRACLGYDIESVRSARNDDDCNILCLPAKILVTDEATSIVEAFLHTPFAAAPRFKRRNRELDEMIS
jgi:ribose 5-phosphate isomerase B